jgi:glycine cleavage system H protein
MELRDNLKYTRSDEWVRRDDEETATIGITDYAQDELGEIVFIELPEVGESISPGVAFGVVESVKAVAEITSPLGGEVIAANTPLVDNPATVNDSPFDEGWMIKIKIADAASFDELLDSEAYREYRS